MIFVLSNPLEKYFSQDTRGFEQMMSLRGEVYRALEGRSTQRIMLNQKQYFIKQHRGVGWKEIFKNMLQGKWPILGAKNEWLALQRLHSLSIAVPNVVAYGSRGKNPAQLQSFIMTEALPKSISLEHFCKIGQKTPLDFKTKCKLIQEVARMTRVLHENGINHRDLYICHFLMDLRAFLAERDIKLYLIDLHRAQIRQKIPLRWRIKDLAGLYFSTKNSGLQQRDYFRFLKAYHGEPFSHALKNHQALWKKARQRGEKLYIKHGNDTD